jgi:hypothetical protein
LPVETENEGEAMKMLRRCVAVLAVGVLACAVGGQTAGSGIADRPDPKEIPVPPIKTVAEPARDA